MVYITLEPRTVSKPWGYELWIADGLRTPYANKKIFFMAGKQTSLQVHKKKYETNYVLSGEGILLHSNYWFNCDLFLNGNMSQEVIDEHISRLDTYMLKPGTTFDVQPGHLHRVIATSDLTFIETSTCELDDVIRLQDDSGRAHGRIDSEHK